LRSSVALLAWASALLIGAVGATLTGKIDVVAPSNADIVDRSLQSASRLPLPAAKQLMEDYEEQDGYYFKKM